MMTVVCCWFDRSYGRERITAIADARTAREIGKDNWHPLSDTTVKMFKVRVKCHTMDGFDPNTVTLQHPYYETEVGIGFSGYCLEAMTIIALFSRVMEQMAAVGDDKPLPTPERIADLLGKIMTRYFAQHTNRAEQKVSFLLFGYFQNEPWISTLKYDPDQALSEQTDNPMRRDRTYAIGDMGGLSFRKELDDLLARIEKHAGGIKPGEGEDAAFDHDLESARHQDAQKKAVEDLTLQKIEKEYNKTVGGVLQKIELYKVDERALVSFSRESKGDILDGLSSADGLVYLPVGETMGNKQARNGEKIV